MEETFKLLIYNFKCFYLVDIPETDYAIGLHDIGPKTVVQLKMELELVHVSVTVSATTVRDRLVQQVKDENEKQISATMKQIEKQKNEK